MYAAYPPHSTAAVELSRIVYSLKLDPATETYQLVTREGDDVADMPVVDHVVGLTFDYYGDRQPPRLLVSDSDPPHRKTTYGPLPPAMPEQIPTRGYPPGENCTFAIDPGTGVQEPRLAVLTGDGESDPLIRLTASTLSDGPWCPDATNVNRWDADLLRIRKIGVSLRVQSANAALRGPAGVLFAHGGTSRSGLRWLPDVRLRFDVAPRNME
jgi:hypothetical protein